MRPLRLLTLVASFSLPAAAFGASTLTGTITNGTVNKPSAGDTVTLIRLAQGMQEATHTTTDAKGHYTLEVPDEAIHLVRVTHENANYFKPAPPGTTSVDIDVYNAAAKVPGVALEADVLRVQTDDAGKNLRVVQHFFLKNESNPPKTQFSDQTFEFTLPAGAQIEGAAAQGPGGMTVQQQPVPLQKKDHYSFNFAIRPGGQTQFQVSYSVPYSGSMTLTPSTAMAAENVILMAPKAMKFDGGKTPWAPVQDEVDAQTYVARNVAANDAATIALSGTGQLPKQTQTADAAGGADASQPQGPVSQGTPDASGGSTPSQARPGGGLGTPIDTPDPLTKYKWWIIAGVGLLLAAGAGFLLSRPQNAAETAAAGDGPTTAAVVPSHANVAPATLLSVLRDEMFALETERLTGKITDEQYARVKPALETVLQHALERKSQTESA